MGNFPSHPVLSSADILPFFLEDDLCTKARSSTAATDELSLCECATAAEPPQRSQRSRHCWGGWIFEQARMDRMRPSPMSIIDSDQESSCSADTPLASAMLSFEIEEDDSIQKLRQQGYKLEQHGRLGEAVATYQSLLELLRATGGSESLGEIHLRTGVLQWKLGDYNESLRHLDQAMFAYQLHGGNMTQSNVDICEVLLATGRVHQSTGNRAVARKCFRNAAQLLQDGQGIQAHAESLYAKVMHAIGTAYAAGGNVDKAVSYCQIALDLQRQSSQSETKVDAAATLLTFGSLFEEMGDYELALRHFTEAYSIYKMVAPSYAKSVDMGATLTNIGLMHHLKGNQHDALDAYNEALVLFRRLGDDRKVATILKQMGVVYVAQGYDDEAASMYEEALQVQRHILGDSHDDVATTLLDLASTTERLQQWQKSIECLDSALQIRRDVLGQDHVQIGDILLYLGEMHTLEGNSNMADQCFAEARTMYRNLQVEDGEARIQRAMMRTTTEPSSY